MEPGVEVVPTLATRTAVSWIAATAAIWMYVQQRNEQEELIDREVAALTSRHRLTRQPLRELPRPGYGLALFIGGFAHGDIRNVQMSSVDGRFPNASLIWDAERVQHVYQRRRASIIYGDGERSLIVYASSDANDDSLDEAVRWAVADGVRLPTTEHR